MAIGNILGGQASSMGSKLTVPYRLASCTPTEIKVCGAFATNADGNQLQYWAEMSGVDGILQIVTGGCPPPSLDGHSVVASLGGTSGPESDSCLAAFTVSTPCS
ncbi:hypothetical protein HYH03_011784 [Edaphochlamys debaryana]|uniref:Uncharacterized protein n=1 Tax=Edaphochlamys debaryana TaxID=47281 RepID=A0A835XTW9_9CHLO|nr:hypothetical protein HYH03_011784 [Edaphochlamys debaryana]|eukprot:KAG2489674.1 hypothetical protein HYH03_011784 [Edaphochlamys debaryana]